MVLSVDVYHNAWYGVTALDTKCDHIYTSRTLTEVITDLY